MEDGGELQDYRIGRSRPVPHLREVDQQGSVHCSDQDIQPVKVTVLDAYPSLHNRRFDRRIKTAPVVGKQLGSPLGGDKGLANDSHRQPTSGRALPPRPNVFG